MAVRPVGESEDELQIFLERETQKNSKSEGIRFKKLDRNMDFERRTRRNVKHFFLFCVWIYIYNDKEDHTSVTTNHNIVSLLC